VRGRNQFKFSGGKEEFVTSMHSMSFSPRRACEELYLPTIVNSEPGMQKGAMRASGCCGSLTQDE